MAASQVCRALVADRLADGREVEEPGAGDVVLRQAVRRHQRRRGILAQVVELVAGGAVGDEADAGRRAGMAAHARGIDAFGPPQLEEGVAHPVLAEAGEVAGRRALAGRRDRDILRIAAETLQPGPAVALARPVEFDQGLAEGDEGRGGGHGVRGFPWCPHRHSRRTKWLTIKPSPAAPTWPRASPSQISPTAACWPAMSARNRCCWSRVGQRGLRDRRRIAATITGRSPKACWSATRCAAPGTTPASACAPARRCARRRLSPIDCWSVEQRDGKVFVTAQAHDAKPAPRGKPAGAAPDRIVIVGGGAAGFAAAEMLRREDYQGQHRHAEQRRCARRSTGPTSPRTTSPATRPRNGCRCAATTSTPTTASTCASRRTSPPSIRARARSSLADGGKVAYDRLLLATGAEPVRLPIPGADLPHVHTLRSAGRQPRHHRARQDGAAARS